MHYTRIGIAALLLVSSASAISKPSPSSSEFECNNSIISSQILSECLASGHLEGSIGLRECFCAGQGLNGDRYAPQPSRLVTHGSDLTISIAAQRPALLHRHRFEKLPLYTPQAWWRKNEILMEIPRHKLRWPFPQRITSTHCTMLQLQISMERVVWISQSYPAQNNNPVSTDEDGGRRHLRPSSSLQARTAWAP